LELSWLISFLKPGVHQHISEEVQKATARTLSVYSYPGKNFPRIFSNSLDEFRKGIREILNKEGIFDRIIHWASLGECPIHREIPRSELTFGEKVADGATASGNYGNYPDFNG
jgi:hypothetical protein